MNPLDAKTADASAARTAPLLQVHDLKVHFPVANSRLPFSGKRMLHAVDGVSLEVRPGETLGIVGESGCGKSTLSRALIGLNTPTSGSIRWRGREIDTKGRRDPKLSKSMQMIFQNPIASLDPRLTIERVVAEPLTTHFPGMGAAQVRERVLHMLERMGLSQAHLHRYPHEFSGGQCQRIGIARALISEPELVICDEPVSALDVSIQAQIVNLLKDLQRETGLAMIFVAHDLAVVKYISHRVLVMYLGRVMEMADKHVLYANPHHPYTRALLAAVPRPDPATQRQTRAVLGGDLPSPLALPSGCVFRTRCAHADAACAQQRPALDRLEDGAAVACIHPQFAAADRASI
jgi:oligopeptide transport system ATP-binding protein